jgi:hypothetical protein
MEIIDKFFVFYMIIIKNMKDKYRNLNQSLFQNSNLKSI